MGCLPRLIDGECRFMVTNLKKTYFSILLFSISNFILSDQLQEKVVAKELIPTIQIVKSQSNENPVLADPLIITNSVIFRTKKEKSLSTVMKKNLGKYEYIILEDGYSVSEFHSSNNTSDNGLRLASFQSRYVIFDGTILIKYLDSNELANIEKKHNVKLKANLHNLQLAAFQLNSFENVYSILAALRQDPTISSVRLDYIDPDIIPQ